MKNSPLSEDPEFSILKMITRSQKRKAITELVSGDFKASIAENNPLGNLIPGPSKSARMEPENLEEIKTSLRKEILSDLTKILAENQKEMPILIAPSYKKQTVRLEDQDSDSDPEISVARTSTPVKSNTATVPKTTPSNSRIIVTETGDLKACHPLQSTHLKDKQGRLRS